MQDVIRRLVDPDLGAEWEIWYQDTFDRECPRQVEVVGQGLVEGLTELWTRHLFETVQVDGQKGFSRFNLWWKQERKSVEVVGDWRGMIRVREWVFGEKRWADNGYIGEGDKELLMRLAETHGWLILADQTSEGILDAANVSVSRLDFEEQLLKLAQDIQEKD